MIRIHKQEKPLRKGSIKLLYAERNVLAYARFQEDEQIIVILNNSKDLKELTVPVWFAGVPKQGRMERLMYTYEEDVSFRIEQLDRPFPKRFFLFMDSDHLFMKREQFFILPAPRICAPVVRICKSAYSRLVSVINGRRSDPCHLNRNRFTHNGIVNAFFRSFRTDMFSASYDVIRPCQETG